MKINNPFFNISNISFHKYDYSQLETVENADFFEIEDPEKDMIFLNIEYCNDTGDYGNLGTIGTANFKAFFDFLNEEEIDFITHAFSYNSEYILIPVTELNDPAKEKKLGEIIELLNDYIVFNDEILSEIEQDLICGQDTEIVTDFLEECIDYIEDTWKRVDKEFQEKLDNFSEKDLELIKEIKTEIEANGLPESFHDINFYIEGRNDVCVDNDEIFDSLLKEMRILSEKKEVEFKKLHNIKDNLKLDFCK